MTARRWMQERIFSAVATNLRWDEMHTCEQIKNALHYDPETGLFTWLISPSQRAPKGSVAGTLNDAGYLLIGFEGKRYRAHRLAWLYMTGEWPSSEIDHRNTNRRDNRWENLREASGSQNQWNQQKRTDNTSGVKGVRFWKNRTHEYAIARLAVHGKIVQKMFSVAKFGRDEAFRLACESINELRAAVHGEFANHAKGA